MKFCFFTYRSISILFTLLVANSTQSFANTSQQPSSKDVVIGTQIWMSENLNVDKFRNGDPIPQAKSKSQWRKAGANAQPAWCYYGFDSSLGKIYGKLYNWFAVVDKRGLAPNGYHVPYQSEWDSLIVTLGGSALASRSLKSKTDWKVGGAGTNASGFNGQPAGFRDAKGFFVFLSEYAKWWTANNGDAKNAWCFYVSHSSRLVIKSLINKSYGLSVRCIKD